MQKNACGVSEARQRRRAGPTSWGSHRPCPALWPGKRTAGAGRQSGAPGQRLAGLPVETLLWLSLSLDQGQQGAGHVSSPWGETEVELSRALSADGEMRRWASEEEGIRRGRALGHSQKLPDWPGRKRAGLADFAPALCANSGSTGTTFFQPCMQGAVPAPKPSRSPRNLAPCCCVHHTPAFRKVGL